MIQENSTTQQMSKYNKSTLRRADRDAHQWAQNFGTNLAANMIWNKYGFVTRVNAAGRLEILSGYTHPVVVMAVVDPAENQAG